MPRHWLIVPLQVFLVFCFAVPLLAQYHRFSGDLNATMSRGETRTFSLDIEFTGQGSLTSGEFRVVASAADGLTLGVMSTDSGAMSCKSNAPTLTECVGTISFAAGQKLRVTQPVTVKQDAASKLANGVQPLVAFPWTIQGVSERLTSQASANGTITVAPYPKVILAAGPQGMVGPARTATLITDEFVLTNVGDAPTTVSIEKLGPMIFGLAPSSLTLAPMASGNVMVQGDTTGREPGVYIGFASVQGPGVSGGEIIVPIKLAVEDRPSAAAQPKPSENRKDTSATLGGPNPQGSVAFTNSGAGPAIGLLSSDAPWLVPPDEVFRVEPGETKPANFTIDLAKQAAILASNGGIGSLTGSLTFRYLLPSAGKTAATITPHQSPGTATTSVTVVSTIKGVVSSGTLPPVPDSPGRFVVAGVGRVVGSVGQFISDLTIFPRTPFASEMGVALADVDLYYVPLGGGTALKATIPAVTPPNLAAFGDLIGSVYGVNQQVGSLHIDAPGTLRDFLGINANVFNVSNPAGTYGTTLPVFSQVFCEDTRKFKLYIPGLRKDSSGHTNMYIQEQCGSPAKVTVDFHDAAGTRIGSTTIDVPPFAAVQIGQATFPEGSASGVLSDAPDSAGRFVAYATPVDRASGDTWALVGRSFRPEPNAGPGFAEPDDPHLIPVAGAVRGANNTYFRTDLAIMNISTVPYSGTLRFHNRTGEVIDRPINLNPLQTQLINDVTTTLFNVTTDNVGHLIFTPGPRPNPNLNAAFAITSRTYTTVGSSTATFGTGVPDLSIRGLVKGTQTFSRSLRRIGGIEDAAISTVSAQRPGTFRTNFGLIEIKGEAVTVKVTIYYTFPANAVAFNNQASATYNLAPRQFLLLSNIANTIIGAETRARLGDLRNMMVEFEVIDGTGEALPFVTSVDNGTGDSTFRVE